MKYIINFRYRVVHALIVHISWILLNYSKGRSENFTTSLEALQIKLPEIDVMKSPPFDQKLIQIITEIDSELAQFISLPDNMEALGHALIQKLRAFLKEIDAFELSEEETLGVRKSRIVEYAKDLQNLIHANVLELKGVASSSIDTKKLIIDLTNDLKRLKNHDFKISEKDAIVDLLKCRDIHISAPDAKKGLAFFQQAVKVEKIFRGEI